MRNSRRQLLHASAGSALLAGLGHSNLAQAQADALRIVTGFTPDGTSDTICRRVVGRLNTAMRAALAAPETVIGLALMGLEAKSSTAAELAARLKADTDRWAPLVKAIGFSADA